jgi:DNA repair exonuclease SbcCD ATPase subunit
MLKVYAENFRSFPVIDWEMPSGLTLIDGINKDTGGSNMAGKTTLLDAWFWCRYGWLPKWKGPKGGSVDAVLRRRNNQVVGRTLVRVEERFGSSTVVIERQRPNRLAVWKDGVPLPGADQKSLEALIGSPERFLVWVYLPQRRQRSFYWMGDNDRTELMSVVSGLEDLERAAEDAKAQRDEAKSEIEQIETRIQILEAQAQDIPVKLKDLQAKRDQAEKQHQDSKEEAERALLRWDSFSYDAQKKTDDEIKEKTSPLVDQLWNIETEIQSLQGYHDSQKKLVDEYPPLDPKFKAKIEKLGRDLEHAEGVMEQLEVMRSQAVLETSLANEAEEGVCSQCDQLLPEASRVEKAERHRMKAAKIKKIISEIEVPEIHEIKKKIEEAQARYDEESNRHMKQPQLIWMKINELQSKIQDKKIEETKLRQEIHTIAKDLKQELATKKDQLYREVQLADRETAHYKNALQTAEETLAMVRDTETKLKNDIRSFDVSLRTWKKRLDQSMDLVEIFGPKGYRAVCFDGLIEKISDRAGQLLSLMTHGLYSTRLEQVGQDSKGNQKIILKPIIIKGGSEVPADDLSGGAEERVALAYDVAVAETAGEGFPLLLDEVLGALDAVGKTEAMTLLEEVSKARPVLVIDHASEFKAMFSQVVRVIYENEESRLEVA